ncbi:MAG: C_GCAxxG_C_C family protein [Candidatus Lokiarchaeota archaeon]|nr:C_GCAxxG_C_C family protein [Candidatus Lokiarchaeota archaeon]
MEVNTNEIVSWFQKGLNCSQFVLSRFGPRFGINEQCSLKIAGGFGGGMTMGNTCGSITAAFMVIGLKFEKINEENTSPHEITYQKIREFVNQFTKLNKTIICNQLTGVDMSTLEGREKARNENIFLTTCPKVIQDSINILESIL